MSEYIVDVGDADEEYVAYFKRKAEMMMGNPIREEIVRCRDCVKWDYDSTHPKKACFEFSNPEDGYIVATGPDGFCAWGEREDA